MQQRSGGSRRGGNRARIARRVAGLAWCAGVVAAASSCDTPSADERALASARRSMAALHSGPDAPSADVQKAVQSEVVTTLRGVGERLPGAVGASAWSLLAQAQAGLAQLDANAAAEADSALLNLATQVRSSADLHAAQHALADALERHDPRPAVTDLDQQSRTLEAELVKAQGSKQREAARLEQLLAAAAEESKQAQERRVAELSTRSSAAHASPAERAAGYEGAHRLAREAAAHEKRAAQIEAEAALVRPLIAVHDLDIHRIEKQRELIGASKAQIERAAQDSAAQASAARASAREAAEALAARLAALDAMLTGDATTRHEAAAAGFASAVASARNAVKAAGQGEGKLGAAVALAGYQQALGDLRGSHGQALAAVAAVLGTVRNATPPAGDAATLDAAIGRLTEQREKSREAAAQAYDGARSSLQGAGARGETAERIKALQSLLPGAPPADTPPAAPPETPPETPANAPADGAPQPSEPAPPAAQSPTGGVPDPAQQPPGE